MVAANVLIIGALVPFAEVGTEAILSMVLRGVIAVFEEDISNDREVSELHMPVTCVYILHMPVTCV